MSITVKRRPTQAQRSAGTQARVLKAAVRCLHAHGYSATTTVLVAEDAKISRGAMLHQFPTKTDLMLFVVRSVFDDSVAQVRKRLESLGYTEENTVQVTWETLSGPPGIAALEILMGSRSDPELSAKLIPLQKQIEQESIALAEMLTSKEDKFPWRTGVRLFHWAVRGLSIGNLLSDNPREMRDALDLLVRMFKTFREVERRKQRPKRPK